MTTKEAQEAAEKLFPFPVQLETVNGVRRVTRELREGDDKAVILNDGKRVLLGAGPSWKVALRYAYKPIGTAQAEEEQKKRYERQAEEREARLKANAFSDFLIEKFGEEFEAWQKKGEGDGSQTPG